MIIPNAWLTHVLFGFVRRPLTVFSSDSPVAGKHLSLNTLAWHYPDIFADNNRLIASSSAH